MAETEPDTSALLHRAAGGDLVATNLLMRRHRERLRQMVAVRLDARLAARVDPSDVVQEAYVDAARRLPEYIRGKRLPFYPWLRQIALDRLADLHRRHIGAQRRSVRREDRLDVALSDASIAHLASHLVSHQDTPSQALLQAEKRRRVQETLAKLPSDDREFLVMRHLEQLTIAEIAEILEISERAAKARQRRAHARFSQHYNDDEEGRR